MDDNELLPPLARFGTKSTRPTRLPDFADGDDGTDEIIAAGDAFATVRGQRQADSLRFLRTGRESFTIPYGYLPIAWWDSPERLLLEYPGLFTVQLLGKDAAALETRISDRRLTWIRECDPAQAALLPVAVFRIDILRSYPSRDAGGGS